VRLGSRGQKQRSRTGLRAQKTTSFLSDEVEIRAVNLSRKGMLSVDMENLMRYHKKNSHTEQEAREQETRNLRSDP
jgi:hypothetical protein